MSDFTREDWTKFRSMGELPRAAGVPPENLKLLVVKELTDNALDAAGACQIGLSDDGVFWVEDNGNGIPGTPQEIADLFSIRRLLTSSKQLRMPTRGALGNGLRVVAGYTLVMDGVLTVYTSGHRLEIVPENDGGTRIMTCTAVETQGTRIELRLGKEKFHYRDLRWGHRAIAFVGASDYAGASSPYWFDEDAFFELCQAYSGSARDLIARFDGCKNPVAGRIAAQWKGREARSLGRNETAELLSSARTAARPVVPKRLGYIGRDHPLLPSGYARTEGIYSPESSRGTVRAELPFIVEAWAEVSEKDSIEINVNRTPVSADVREERLQPKTDVGLFGCGLRHRISVGFKPVRVIVNVQTPYMAITSDGKAPDLTPMVNEIVEAIEKATRIARRAHTTLSPAVAQRRTETDIVRGCLDKAIEKASGNGSSRYSLRQLFYQVRPYILEELGKEPTYEHFANIITNVEKERGCDLPGIYRDTRGTLYHPHTREEISLGTLSVEGYERPAWTFNKIIYCEKEGFFEILKDARWPERHDCALLTSKGQPTRAARDILDLMGESAEELVFFCVHDADAAGTVIYQSLQEETKARAARRVRIINLGLEPAEALEMDLQPEKLDKTRSGGRSVAEYVLPEWAEWLQTNRVELNAMTSPQFIEWLDSKMAQYDGSKLVPPAEVLEGQLRSMTKKKVRDELVEKTLAAANIENQVDAALIELSSDIESAVTRLEAHTRAELAREPVNSWTAPVEGIALVLVGRSNARRSVDKKND